MLASVGSNTPVFFFVFYGLVVNDMVGLSFIVLYCTTVVMYLYSVIPSKSAVVLYNHPLNTSSDASLLPCTDLFAKFTYLPTHQMRDTIPLSLRTSTLELASNNLVCSVALTGVLALQAGRWWAERADPDEEDVVTTAAVAEAEAEKLKLKLEKAAATQAGGRRKSQRKASKQKALS